MTQSEARSFVARFAQAWADKDAAQFQALWLAHGWLHHPFADRLIQGSEIGRLDDLQKTSAPKLTWRLIGWTHRDEVIAIEWQSTNTYAGQRICRRGVDKLTVLDGRIIEEIVYSDAAPLRAALEHRKFPALMKF